MPPRRAARRFVGKSGPSGVHGNRARFAGGVEPILKALKLYIKNKSCLYYPTGKGARRNPKLLVAHANMLQEFMKMQPNLSFKYKDLEAAIAKLSASFTFEDSRESDSWQATMNQRISKMFRDTSQGVVKNKTAPWVKRLTGENPVVAAFATSSVASTSAREGAKPAEEEAGEEEDGVECEEEEEEEELLEEAMEPEGGADDFGGLSQELEKDPALLREIAAHEETQVEETQVEEEVWAEDAQPPEEEVCPWFVGFDWEQRMAWRQLDPVSKNPKEYTLEFASPLPTQEPHEPVIFIWHEPAGVEWCSKVADFLVRDLEELKKQQKVKLRSSSSSYTSGADGPAEASGSSGTAVDVAAGSVKPQVCGSIIFCHQTSTTHVCHLLNHLNLF